MQCKSRCESDPKRCSGDQTVTGRECYSAGGGCKPKKIPPEEQKCRFPIKRPLPSCENPYPTGATNPDQCVAADELVPTVLFQNLQATSANARREAHKALMKVAFQNKDKTDINVQKYVSETREIPEIPNDRCKANIMIDNAAQIMNVSIPREGCEEGVPMKLKPQFWSKFTKTTTLPIKIDTSNL